MKGSFDLSDREDSSNSNDINQDDPANPVNRNDSSAEDSTTSFVTSSKKGGNSSSESSTLAKAETRAVNRSKMAVLMMLFVAATAVGVATYIFARNAEYSTFEQKFYDFAVEVQDLVHVEARNTFLTVHTFSTTITSFALSTGLQWPFVSLPHYEIRGLEMNDLSNALLLAFAPYVSAPDRNHWERYTTYMQGWIQEGVDHSYEELHETYYNGSYPIVAPIDPNIHVYLDSARDDPNPSHIPVPSSIDPDQVYMPVWQVAPAPHDPKAINYNLLDNEVFRRVDHGMHSINKPVLSEATDLEFLYDGSIREDPTHPHSFLLQPVYHDFVNVSEAEIMGVVVAVIGWDHYFENLLQPEAHGVIVVMADTCGDVFTYQINGGEAVFLGYGDHHDPHYDYLQQTSLFDPLTRLNVSDEHEHCEYDMHIYPSRELEVDYLSNNPIFYTLAVISVFLGTVLTFILYDYFVQYRQDKVMLAAKKSNAVVASLFPKQVRDRIYQDVEEQLAAGQKPGRKNLMFGAVAKHELKHFLDADIAKAATTAFDTKPIADLFPSTTVMFADIVGFTAWSSVREPSQVFSLLETVYAAFDEIAKRRRVFKVETVGDCYVAVSGLPEPRKDHATVMARFSRDCLAAMNDLTKKLEISLGPDTGDLSMRVGLHSGPVTAGVLRGDKSRFQLFGDTVNTAARLEQCGVRNKIHVSAETAELLRMGGKNHWLVRREDKIVAKGKGELESYWLDLKHQSSGSARSGESGKSGSSDASSNLDAAANLASLGPKEAHDVDIDPVIPPKIKRLVKWNADVLLRILKQVVARREANEQLEQEELKSGKSPCNEDSCSSLVFRHSSITGHTVIDEVKEIIMLPRFSARAAKIQKNPSDVELDPKVVQQLHDYITVIASMYRQDVPFHNFEHASHVTMSVVKLLSRIVAPDDVLMTEVDKNKENDEICSALHDHTYGITSDPLTQFAVVFSALIHDVDHTGAPNSQLLKEGAEIASIYKGKSIAEQNSVDLAWSLLMEDCFAELRNTIYKTEDEKTRFRQLVVNVVLATDIVDKDLKALRNARWEKAFKKEAGGPDHLILEAKNYEDVNRKATIILEHLIQASDIAHTMQHWHIYRKWNEMFFQENMVAYHQGRAEKDPSEFWYKGEIGFFDFYIIPLAKKLKECGVFGVSCDEYLNYAMANRKEWELRGEDVVAEMAEKYRTILPEKQKEIHPIEEADEE